MRTPRTIGMTMAWASCSIKTTAIAASTIGEETADVDRTAFSDWRLAKRRPRGAAGAGGLTALSVTSQLLGLQRLVDRNRGLDALGRGDDDELRVARASPTTNRRGTFVSHSVPVVTVPSAVSVQPRRMARSHCGCWPVVKNIRRAAADRPCEHARKAPSSCSRLTIARCERRRSGQPFAQRGSRRPPLVQRTTSAAPRLERERQAARRGPGRTRRGVDRATSQPSQYGQWKTERP